MTLINEIRADLLSARKERNETVKNLLTALVGEAVAVGKNNGNRETSNDETIAIIKKFIKNAEDTKLALTTAKRDVTTIQSEIDVLNGYVPKQLSEIELNELLVRYQTLHDNTNLGSAMKYLKEHHAGLYDGKLASAVAKRVFG